MNPIGSAKRTKPIGGNSAMNISSGNNSNKNIPLTFKSPSVPLVDPKSFKYPERLPYGYLYSPIKNSEG